MHLVGSKELFSGINFALYFFRFEFYNNVADCSFEGKVQVMPQGSNTLTGKRVCANSE